VIPEHVRTAFSPDVVYLDTGSMGLPPQPVVEAMTADIERWHAGTAQATAYDKPVTMARELFAGLVGVDAADVAIGATVSSLAGFVAASLPDGAQVIAPEGDFTSVLFPFAAHGHRGVRVRTVPLERLAEAVDGDTSLIALSVVQSADGRVADLDAISAAATSHGAQVFVDATQAAGWLPIDAAGVDYLAAGAYKWLLSPRGSAFLYLRPEHRERLVPLAAGWYAGEDVWSSIYGLPLRLASDARRFDVSPAWLSWVGTAAALEFITEVGVQDIHDHDVALANQLRAGLGMTPSDSAIVSVQAAGAADRLDRHGIRAGVRSGAVRLCFHLHNTDEDVRTTLAALG
jgi:selenocysteine lyase/cysteine desulfurase